MNRKALVTLFLSQLLIFICACSSIECPVKHYIGTKKLQNKDTLLLNKSTNSTSFELPISYQHPEDTLYFCITDTTKVSTTDTVWIKKDDTPHFESVDCNPGFFHQLTGVRCTHHRIDTIVINHSLVDYESSTEHFHISFK